MTEVMELPDTGIKTAVISMFKHIKENMNILVRR